MGDTKRNESSILGLRYVSVSIYLVKDGEIRLLRVRPS